MLPVSVFVMSKVIQVLIGVTSFDFYDIRNNQGLGRCYQYHYHLVNIIINDLDLVLS